MNWATQFKIAIANKDASKVIEAFEALPPLETMKNLDREVCEEIADYMEQGIEILKEARKRDFENVDKMKKVRQFLKNNPYGGGSLA